MNTVVPGASSDQLSFELPGTGRVLFTTRAQGNMSSVGGLDHEHGYDARERLRTQLGLRRLARGYQVHGTIVLRSRTDADIPEPDATTTQPPVQADGHATSVAGVGAMVLTADCLPVALGAGGAVAMVHAGWRGLAAGVLEEGVWALREPLVRTTSWRSSAPAPDRAATRSVPRSTPCLRPARRGEARSSRAPHVAAVRRST